MARNRFFDKIVLIFSVYFLTCNDKSETNSSFVIVELDTIQARTSISDQYISFYDEACTTWLDVRENDKIEVKTPIEEFKQKKESVLCPNSGSKRGEF